MELKCNLIMELFWIEPFIAAVFPEVVITIMAYIMEPPISKYLCEVSGKAVQYQYFVGLPAVCLLFLLLLSFMWLILFLCPYTKLWLNY